VIGGGEGNRVGAAGAIRSCPLLVVSGKGGRYHAKAANRMALGLGAGYAAVVLGLGRLLPQGSSLAVAAATLAVAAAFQPARRHIQHAVDRRFNRRRHDAGQAIAAFGTRLRDQVDLDTLSTELLAVVDETMQPTRASLWLRPHPVQAAVPHHQT
jgi:hypothetical protein